MPARAKSLLHSLEQTARGSFQQDSAIPSRNGKLLKLVDQFTYLGSNISPPKSKVTICTRKGSFQFLPSCSHISLTRFLRNALSKSYKEPT